VFLSEFLIVKVKNLKKERDNKRDDMLMEQKEAIDGLEGKIEIL